MFFWGNLCGGISVLCYFDKYTHLNITTHHAPLCGYSYASLHLGVICHPPINQTSPPLIHFSVAHFWCSYVHSRRFQQRIWFITSVVAGLWPDSLWFRASVFNVFFFCNLSHISSSVRPQWPDSTPHVHLWAMAANDAVVDSVLFHFWTTFDRYGIGLGNFISR